MKIWKIERTVGVDYDQYSAAIVIASSAEEARYIHPNGDGKAGFDSTWPVQPDDLTVTLIGNAERNLKSGTVICASFHAG